MVFSDAGEYAGSGYISGYGSIAHFMWEIEDRTKRSTWRELKTLENILYSISNQLSGKLVKLYTDNQNVTRIVKKGSMKAGLQNVSLSIFHLCLKNNIVFEVEWIPNDKNSCAG